jgi:putative phosphoesterase
MKICVFSDIHGNGAAFLPAYKQIISEKADLNIYLGDLCGYYYDQLMIYNFLVTIPNLIALKGNHDALFLRIHDGDSELRKVYLNKYGHSMEVLLSQNVAELKEWLGALPASYSAEDISISCYHGSPKDMIEGYVYPDSSLDEFQSNPFEFILLGHTHYSMNRSIHRKLILNPGSLGQPRNGDLPTYMVIDHATREVILKKINYDKSNLLKQIESYGDSSLYLRKILGTQN